MHCLILFIVLFITACSSNQKKNSEFYTWVDESGVLRTEKKATEPKSAVTSENKTQINEDNYISSEELDKKLSNTRLFAWQDETGKQYVMEESTNSEQSNNKVHYSNTYQNLTNYREGRQFLLSELLNREIRLSDFYRFNNHEANDYLLIEVDEPKDKLLFKSFIKNSAVSLPEIIQLNSKYQQLVAMGNIWKEITRETWQSYGHVSGVIFLEANTNYLLIKPSDSLTPIKDGDQIIKLSDLGVLTIKDI